MNSELPTTPFDLSTTNVGLDRSLRAQVGSYGDGLPPTIDGLNVGIARISESPPHGGERHPDGDELIYLVSGRAEIVLEEESGERSVTLEAGQAFVVPKGTWHRVLVLEPCEIVYVTPGPNGEHRPPA